MTHDPDDNDAFSGYRPDMDQHPDPLPQTEWHGWTYIAIFVGTAFWIAVGILVFA